MTYESRTLSEIARLKSLQPDSAGAVISGHIRRTDFSVSLLTRGSQDNPSIIRRLARWRKKHERFFAVQFPVSVEATKTWLVNRVLREPDRLLFMIRVRDTYIGHIGLYRFHFGSRTCELDNIVRGVAGYPGIMSESVRLLMDWGAKTLGLQSYTLQTTSDNKNAIQFYSQLGFTETKRTPKVYIRHGSMGQWQDPGPEYRREIRRYDVYMKRKES